jgi:hypothetical protein
LYKFCFSKLTKIFEFLYTRKEFIGLFYQYFFLNYIYMKYFFSFHLGPP